MRLKLIACEVFRREFCHAAAHASYVIDIHFQPYGLHGTPDLLRADTQKQIDEASPNRYAYILLGYGLCSRGTADLQARDIPLIIPRAHDCITLFLGSRACYNQQFLERPGTYYYSPGWIEHRDGTETTTQQGTMEIVKEKQRQRQYQQYVDKYGEDNAKYLMEMEKQWVVNYDRAAFINTGLGNIEEYRQFTQRIAQSNGWQYEEIEGDITMIERFLNGDWDEESFLEVPPGHRIVDVYDDGVITAEPAS